MSTSSDSEIELAQRTQPKATSIPQASSLKAKSPWDLMKSKQNKAFSKSYLQGMMNVSSPSLNVPKSPNGDHNITPNRKVSLTNKKSSLSNKSHSNIHDEDTDDSEDEKSVMQKSPKKTSTNNSIKSNKKSILSKMSANDFQSSGDEFVNPKSTKITPKKSPKSVSIITNDTSESSSDSEKHNTIILNKNSSTAKINTKHTQSKHENTSESDSSSDEMPEKDNLSKNSLLNGCSSSDDSETDMLNNKNSLNRSSLAKIATKTEEESDSSECDSDSDQEMSVERKRNQLTKAKTSPDSEKEIQSDVSTLAKISPLKRNSSINTSSKSNIGKNEFLLKKLNTYAELNSLEKVETKTCHLINEISSNEIFLVQIPKDLNPNQIINKMINFEEPTIIEVDDNNSYKLNVNNKNISNVLIADSSEIDDSFNILSIKPNGFISVCKENKIKRRSLKINKHLVDEVIEEPKNLKEHHLLLGHDYKEHTNLDKWISDKLDGLITNFNKKQAQKRKKKSLEKKRESKNHEENLDIFKLLLDEHTEEKEKCSRLEESIDEGIHKKKKKKKLNKEVEKSEMDESIDIINQMLMENKDVGEETKKQKRKRSKSMFQETPVNEEMKVKKVRSNSVSDDQTILNDTIKSKKNKKDKLQYVRDKKELDISPKKAQKSFINSTMVSPQEGNTTIFDNEQSVISKIDKDASLTNFIDDLIKDVDNTKDKKKKRKRSSLGNEVKDEDKKRKF